MTVFSALRAFHVLRTMDMELPEFGWIDCIAWAYLGACMPLGILSGIALGLASLFGIEVEFYWPF